MKKTLLPFCRLSLLFFTTVFLYTSVFAQPKNATVKINKNVSYQKVTGFGGFVNSPQFGYNHMSEAEIRKMWGAASEAGYNIIRLYIPTGENNWSQVINTAKLAKSLGLKIFASPWSMPTQWKTDPVIGSVFTDENGAKRNVYLKEENYADYANYLNNFVVLLRNNGVELDAISIQNEPDYQVDYAGCFFTTAQITKFLKENRQLISCKVMAPETVGIPDNYANAFNAADVLPHFDIFAGHQYGGIQSAYKNLQTKGKEVWMTEFLINWNPTGTSRNFNWSIDAFDFAGKVNEAMLGNINAWIHYATKRYYGMMGDGSFGTTISEITKRGRVLSHYAKYVTGATRIDAVFNDNSGQLKGSSYLSVTGDSVVVVVINASTNSYNLAVDLPFLSNAGKVVKTTETENMTETTIGFSGETNRPKVTVSPSSVTTLVFVKSGELIPSQMTGELANYTKIDSINATNAAFGTVYKLSGKTATFSVNAPLISANQTAANGYLPLPGKFNRLVFRVESIASAGSFTSANTTLFYINAAGAVKSYNYGTVTFNLRNNFDWAIDISENTLTDGCQGIIGLTNGNYNSILTLKLNNVFVAIGNERGYKFTGPYSKSDGNLLDCLDDITFTSLDFTNVSGIPATANWDSTATNKNAVYYVNSVNVSDKTNVVYAATSNKLELRDLSGDFFPKTAFNTANAKYTATINGYKMMVLPFAATIPAGVKAFTLEFLDPAVRGKIISTGIIPANTPVLVNGTGTFEFTGNGLISPAGAVQSGISNGVYVGIKVPLAGYYLKIENEIPAFSRATTTVQPAVGPFDAYLKIAATTAASLQIVLDETLPVKLGVFTVVATNQHIVLNWNTYAEINNHGFAIEHSTDGRLFEQIGFVKANGSGNTAGQYSYTDKSPFNGINYYRIKQTDIDGASNYSPVKTAHFGGSPLVTLFPNPVKNVLNIDGNGQQLSGTVFLYDVTGRLVKQAKVVAATIFRMDVTALNTGTYFYRFNQLKGSFVKQ